MIRVAFEIATNSQKIVLVWSVVLSVTATYHLYLFAGKSEETECTSCLTPSISARAKMTYQLQMCGQHWITIVFGTSKKEHEQEF